MCQSNDASQSTLHQQIIHIISLSNHYQTIIRPLSNHQSQLNSDISWYFHGLPITTSNTRYESSISCCCLQLCEDQGRSWHRQHRANANVREKSWVIYLDTMGFGLQDDLCPKKGRTNEAFSLTYIGIPGWLECTHCWMSQALYTQWATKPPVSNCSTMANPRNTVHKFCFFPKVVPACIFDKTSWANRSPLDLRS